MIYILHVKGVIFVAAIIGLFALKVKFNLNKYLMWGVFSIGYYMLTGYLAGESILPAGLTTTVSEL
ncbi:hypothetical protein EON65_29080 [archaeon]|nr:MAG: hypothetical protein EON65_29080 [archaeon]